jgi:hypothetical protein
MSRVERRSRVLCNGLKSDRYSAYTENKLNGLNSDPSQKLGQLMEREGHEYRGFRHDPKSRCACELALIVCYHKLDSHCWKHNAGCHPHGC